MEYIDYDVGTDRDKAREMIEISGQNGTPVIIIDGEMVIGFNQDKLNELLDN